MVDVSLVLCCHNAAERLPETIAHLVKQDAPDDIWEVIIVDNASTDDTAEVARACWTRPSVPFRVVREDLPGVVHARTRGFKEASGTSVCFVDDDNWLTESWVRVVAEIMTANPTVGMLGSRSEAVTNGTLPDWFDGLRRAFAIGEQSAVEGDVTDTVSYFWGAGLTIRAEAWAEATRCGFVPTMEGRTATELSSGGDAEVCLALGRANWRLWYDRRLLLSHFIPEGRLSWTYTRRLHRGFGDSEWRLALYKANVSDKAGQDSRIKSWAFWPYAVCASSLNLIRLIASSPSSTIRGGEGNSHVLQVERAYGRLISVLKRRRDLGRWRRDVRRYLRCVSAPHHSVESSSTV